MGRRLFATPRHDWRRIGFGSAMIVIVLAASGFVLLREKPVRIDPNDANQVALGKRLYAMSCASCHGTALEGQPNWQRRLPNGRLPAPPHDASGHTWHHSDAFLMDVTRRGPAAYPEGYLTDMPAFRENLSDREVSAILAFIKSQWPEDIRVRQNRLNGAR